MDVEVYDALPGRPNVVGMADGRERGPTLMFCGHLDTVGVECGHRSIPSNATAACTAAAPGHEGWHRSHDPRR